MKPNLFLAVIFILVNVFVVSPAFCDEKTMPTVASLLQEAEQAESIQNWERAVEYYRRVIFLDGSDLDSQFHLARALFEKGDFAKAYKEFRRFTEDAPKNDRLSNEAKQPLLQQAAAMMQQSKQKNKGPGLLSFLDINILLVTFFLTLIFLFQVFAAVNSHFPKLKGEEKELQQIFREPYWKEQVEKEIHFLSPVFGLVVLFLVWVFFCLLSFQVLKSAF